MANPPGSRPNGDGEPGAEALRSTLVGRLVREAIGAVGDEIAAASDTSNAQSYTLTDGKLVVREEGPNLLTYRCDEPLPVPADSPASLHLGSQVRPVAVLASGDLDVVLACDEPLPEDISQGVLTPEPWFIYEALRKHLDETLEADGSIGATAARLFGITEPEVSAAKGAPSNQHHDELNAAQAYAVGRALELSESFIWGPPGTGKTRTLAAVCAAMLETEDRVVVVAHANVAVDVAAIQLAEELRGSAYLSAGHVLRVGDPQLDLKEACPEVLPDEVIKRRFPELVAERERLRAERSRLSAALSDEPEPSSRSRLADELQRVRSELTQVEEQLRQERRSLVRDARVVLATLARTAIDQTVWDFTERAAVIVDEASMAGLPFVLALALRSPSRIVFVGDFRQLPPVSQSTSERAVHWFGRDIFEAAGVVQRIERGGGDARVTMLDLQYRMAPPIAAVVSELAYGGRLRTAPGVAEQVEALAQLAPAPGSAIVMVDTSTIGAACLREADPGSYSRFNPVHAAITSRLLEILGDEADLAIVTPYRAQAQLYAALTRDSLDVAAATTHRFQGSERDVVVVDLVDASHQEGASRLTGTDVDLARRLVNVAVSRSRGKLILIADRTFIRDHHPPSSPSIQVLALAEGNGARTLDAGDLLSRGAAAKSALVNMISSASEVVANLPSRDAVSAELAEALEDLADGDTPVRVHCDIGVARRLESSRAELSLLPLGHAPFVVIDGRRTWIGGSGRHLGWTPIENARFAGVLLRMLGAD